MFQYDFMIRALITGTMISLSASLLGTNLVLKRNSLIGDGLSHVGFGSMAIALVLNQQPLIFSMVIAIIAAFLILKVSQSTQISGDAMIGIISSTSLAIGVVVIQLFGMNADISSFMFGSILAVNQSDVLIAFGLAILVTTGTILLYNRIFAMTFDETFAKAVGLKTDRYQSVFAILTAIVVVVGMRLMGALLISGLIIFPSIIAMQLFDSYKKVTIAASILGVIHFIIGLILSSLLNTPTGASVILVNAIVLLVTFIFKQVIQNKD